MEPQLIGWPTNLNSFLIFNLTLDPDRVTVAPKGRLLSTTSKSVLCLSLLKRFYLYFIDESESETSSVIFHNKVQVLIKLTDYAFFNAINNSTKRLIQYYLKSYKINHQGCNYYIISSVLKSQLIGIYQIGKS